MKWQYRQWLRDTKERIILRIAWRLPRSLVYWCGIRMFVEATSGEHARDVLPELPATELFQRWEGGNG